MSRPVSNWLFFLCFLLILGVHFLWEAGNDLPPVWDMAYHQLRGWEYLEAWRRGEFLTQFSRLSSYYPPLYYLQEAFILRFFSNTEFLALLSNLLGLSLMAYCTFRIAALNGKSLAAHCAGLLPLLFPLVAWTSRHSLLDVSLSAWVAAGAYLILRSQLFVRRGWTLIFGGVLVAGMLTKWTFALYLCCPVFYALFYSSDRRRSVAHFADALIVSIPVIFLWYLPNLIFLVDRFAVTSRFGVLEGDPGLGNLLGWIYYPRSLSSYYLYLPLTLLLLWSAVSSWRADSSTDLPAQSEREGFSGRFLWWWLLGGLALLTLLEAKDPRYVMPLVSPVAILLLRPWVAKPGWAVMIFVFAFLQFLTVSFPFPFLPDRVAFFGVKNDTDYRSLRQEWVLYQSHYFDVAGPPRREDWRYDDLLEKIPAGVSVGFVPDLPHFHPDALRLHAVRQGRAQEVARLGQSQDSVRLLDSVTFVVGKSGFQGISYITPFNREVYRRLEELGWSRMQTWDLPDQSQALLWRSPTPCQ